jgi:hypothetical protein
VLLERACEGVEFLGGQPIDAARPGAAVAAEADLASRNIQPAVNPSEGCRYS